MSNFRVFYFKRYLFIFYIYKKFSYLPTLKVLEAFPAPRHLFCFGSEGPGFKSLQDESFFFFFFFNYIFFLF